MRRVKRKKYIVSRQFQYKTLLGLVLTILLTFILFSGGVIGYYWIAYASGDNLFREYITVYKQIRAEETVMEEEGERSVQFYTTKTIPGVKRWEIVLPPLLINNFLIMVILTILGVFFSHRIAGPVYRITMDLQRIMDGDYRYSISLRKHDHFSELAAQINNVLDQFIEERSNFLEERDSEKPVESPEQN